MTAIKQTSVCPSGVPFLEVLEFEVNGERVQKCPSGVPFLEVLESNDRLNVARSALAECHSLRC